MEAPTRAQNPSLHCPTCGYNLTGLPENRCPECGQAFAPEVVSRQREGRPFPWASRILLIIAVPILGLVTSFLLVDVAGLDELFPILIVAVVAGAVATSFHFARRMVGQLRIRSELFCASSDLQYFLAWVLMFVLAIVWQIACIILLIIFVVAAGDL